MDVTSGGEKLNLQSFLAKKSLFKALIIGRKTVSLVLKLLVFLSIRKEDYPDWLVDKLLADVHYVSRSD